MRTRAANSDELRARIAAHLRRKLAGSIDAIKIKELAEGLLPIVEDAATSRNEGLSQIWKRQRREGLAIVRRLTAAGKRSSAATTAALELALDPKNEREITALAQRLRRLIRTQKEK